MASFWNELKGINYFVQLANKLPVQDFQIVLVGNINKKENKLPESITWIRSTNNITELCEIYSMADVFVNPTRQENFPTVNLEALSCGTPVVCFASGGTAETINDRCGVAVARDDYQALKREIIRVCEDKPFSDKDCVKWASSFDKNDKFKQYLQLYF